MTNKVSLIVGILLLILALPCKGQNVLNVHEMKIGTQVFIIDGNTLNRWSEENINNVQHLGEINIIDGTPLVHFLMKNQVFHNLFGKFLETYMSSVKREEIEFVKCLYENDNTLAILYKKKSEPITTVFTTGKIIELPSIMFDEWLPFFKSINEYSRPKYKFLGFESIYSGIADNDLGHSFFYDNFGLHLIRAEKFYLFTESSVLYCFDRVFTNTSREPDIENYLNKHIKYTKQEIIEMIEKIEKISPLGYNDISLSKTSKIFLRVVEGNLITSLEEKKKFREYVQSKSRYTKEVNIDFEFNPKEYMVENLHGFIDNKQFIVAFINELLKHEPGKVALIKTKGIDN